VLFTHRRQPALRDAAGTRASRHLVHERVVAAGVQYQDAQLRGADELEHGVEAGGFDREVTVARELRIHGDQVVFAVRFHAVAGVVHHRELCAVGLGAERLQRLVQRRLREVRADVDCETGAAQGIRDEPGIRLRVRQCRDGLV
jgi:hypothetical protein